MDSLELAVLLCKRFEGFYSRPYLCPAGVPTIGYGSTHYPNGRAVTLNDPAISKQLAEFLLRKDILARSSAVDKLCRTEEDGQRAALIDFAYNLGIGALKNSTLRRRVNAGQWDKVPTELRKWVNGGGRQLPGLIKRRAAEISLL